LRRGDGRLDGWIPPPLLFFLPDPSSTKSHIPSHPSILPIQNPAETGAAGDGEEGAGGRFVAIFYNLARGGREWRGVEGREG